MARTKRLVCDTTAGWTIYAEVMQESDSYVLDGLDGAFKANRAACGTPDLPMPWNPATNRYEYSTAATAWTDGLYTARIYHQLGGTPNPATDTLLRVVSMYITGDTAAASVYVPVAGSATLAQIIAKVRRRLDDVAGPDYLWSNEVLTDIIDEIQKRIIAEIPLIVDRTSTAVCDVAAAQGAGVITLHPKIATVLSARIDGQSRDLDLVSAQDLAIAHPDWNRGTATSGVPTVLAVSGLGNNIGFLYPPVADVAGVTVKLMVSRLPILDLTWPTHRDEYLEIDKYVHLITHAIMWQAYLQDDSDTFNEKKAEQHRVYWEGRQGWGGDKDKIKRMVLAAQPHNWEGIHPGVL